MIAYKPAQHKVEPHLWEEIVRRIVKAVGPEKIVLFGSRARGDHRPDSDIDLLVIKESNVPRSQRPVAIHAALEGLPNVPCPASRSFEVDAEVMVYTPKEVEEW